MNSEHLENLGTELENPRSTNMDQMEIQDFLFLMNQEDENAIQAVREVIPDIERAVKTITLAIKNGGRLIYVGADEWTYGSYRCGRMCSYFFHNR